MNKMILTLLGLLMIISANATDDEYYPLVREGVTWYHFWYKSIHSSNSSDFLYSYNCEGDTIVDDKGEMKTYKKIVYKEYDNSLNVTCSAVLRCMREESKVVYVKDLYEKKSDLPEELWFKPLLEYPYWAGWDEENSQFYNGNYHYEDPIYDFNRETFLPDDHGISTYYRKHYYATTATVNEEIHNAYAIDDGIPAYSAIVIEGIGIDSKGGQLLAPQIVLDVPHDGLAWVEENGVVIYQGVMYDRAMEYLANLTDISTFESDKQVLSVRYYNLAGVESPEPFDGVSIKVTTWSDGTRSSEKVIK